MLVKDRVIKLHTIRAVHVVLSGSVVDHRAEYKIISKYNYIYNI